MASPSAGHIHETLAAGRRDADRILADAAARARELEQGAGKATRQRAREQLERLEEVRRDIHVHSQRIDAAYVAMIEAMAATSMRLVAVAREADFSPPELPGGLSRAVELKLSETKTMSVRLETGGWPGTGAAG